VELSAASAIIFSRLLLHSSTCNHAACLAAAMHEDSHWQTLDRYDCLMNALMSNCRTLDTCLMSL